MTTIPEAPKHEAEWTAERQIAVGILGRLAVEGFLADTVIQDAGNLNYAMDAIAEEISRALTYLPGGADGDLDAVLSQSAVGELHRRPAKGGAE